MAETALEIARRGLDAWGQGDFSTMESILDPNVGWRSFEPGAWDCENRGDVMGVLRGRYEQGFSRAELEFLSLGEEAVIVVAHPSQIGGEGWPDEAATILRFAEGRVVDMQDYPTRQDALEAGAST